jgi:hypothetical protein
VSIPFRFSSNLTGKKAKLRCALGGLTLGDEIEIKVNDTPLQVIAKGPDQAGCPTTSIPTTFHEEKLNGPPLVSGANTLHLKLTQVSSIRTSPIKAGEFEIVVDSIS